MNVGRTLLRRQKKSFRTSTRWRTAREVLSEAEGHFRNGGVYEKAGNTEHGSGEKIVGQDFFALFREYNVQRLQSMLRRR